MVDQFRWVARAGPGQGFLVFWTNHVGFGLPTKKMNCRIDPIRTPLDTGSIRLITNSVLEVSPIAQDAAPVSFLPGQGRGVELRPGRSGFGVSLGREDFVFREIDHLLAHV